MTKFYWDSSPKIRSRHLYIPGDQGSGKTSLMANLALDEIEARRGPVIVIDPKGSKQGLVERVIKHIPQSMIPDVYYVSLKHPVPIDIFGYRNDFEKQLIRSDIIYILQKFCSFGTWGSTLQGTLNKLVPTLLEAEDATFLDIGNFLESKKRRTEILKQVSKDRREWWEENPPARSDFGPLATRMSNFAEPPLSIFVSGKRREGLNIADIIEQNKILLVDLSSDSDDAYMLGALMMSKIQQAIFRRDPDEDHPLCTLFADEFHEIQASGFKKMLTKARSFGLSLCLANQYPGQVKDIWDDITGIATYLIFRLDGEKARMLRFKLRDPKPPSWDDEQSYEGYFLNQIPSLPVGQAIFVDNTGLTALIKTPPPPIPAPQHFADAIKQATAGRINTPVPAAENGTNRSPQPNPSQSRENGDTEGNGNRTEIYTGKEDPKDQKSPNIPRPRS